MPLTAMPGFEADAQAAGSLHEDHDGRRARAGAKPGCLASEDSAPETEVTRPGEELAEIKKQLAELQQEAVETLTDDRSSRGASHFGESRSFLPSPKNARFRPLPSGLACQPFGDQPATDRA
jgi:hypothetical protein